MLDNFYRIIDQRLLLNEEKGAVQAGRSVHFTIGLEPSHPIYEGHFPGNPVVPGVCQVQIIKELVSLTLTKNVLLFKSDNIKFLSMINPAAIPELHVRLDIREKEENQWDVNAVISREQQVFIKFKGLFLAV